MKQQIEGKVRLHPTVAAVAQKSKMKKYGEYPQERK